MPQTLMVRDLNAHYEAGVYVVLYDGDGIMSFAYDCVKEVRRSVGRIELQVVPSTSFNNGIAIRIEWTNKNDPLRNIRVIRPGFEKTYKFRKFMPYFLHFNERFSYIRFMDFMATNSEVSGNWSQRTTSKNRTYSIDGVPLEDIIELSNILGTDVWLNVPHLATDDYVQKMATLLNNTLRPDVKIYIEYSNEVWGALFPGGNYAMKEGINMELANNPADARFCYLALRSHQIFDIFESVFNERSRLKFLLAS